MDANSCGSMSSWCIGLKAGPAGLPGSGASRCRGLSARRFGRHQPVLCIRHYVRVLLTYLDCPFDCAQGLCTARRRARCRFLLRGPAPRGYNGDGECTVGTARSAGRRTREGGRGSHPTPSADDCPSPISIRLYVTYRNCQGKPRTRFPRGPPSGGPWDAERKRTWPNGRRPNGRPHARKAASTRRKAGRSRSAGEEDGVRPESAAAQEEGVRPKEAAAPARGR